MYLCYLLNPCSLDICDLNPPARSPSLPSAYPNERHSSSEYYRKLVVKRRDIIEEPSKLGVLYSDPAPPGQAIITPT